MTDAATMGLPELPEGFRWDDHATWPEEFRQLFTFAAQVAYLALIDQDKRMLDVQIEGTTEPVTLLFAIGDRGEELRQAWRSVFALHNNRVPAEPVDVSAAASGEPPTNPPEGAQATEHPECHTSSSADPAAQTRHSAGSLVGLRDALREARTFAIAIERRIARRDDTFYDAVRIREIADEALASVPAVLPKEERR